MKLARVMGTVVSTHKEPSLTGTKFLLVQMLDGEGNKERYPVGALIVAIVDTVAVGNKLTYSKRDSPQ
jgi:carbon dioxide concentrating mechanism protein CcmL